MFYQLFTVLFPGIWGAPIGTKSIFGFCRMCLGCGPASGPTLKKALCHTCLVVGRRTNKKIQDYNCYTDFGIKWPQTSQWTNKKKKETFWLTLWFIFVMIEFLSPFFISIYLFFLLKGRQKQTNKETSNLNLFASFSFLFFLNPKLRLSTLLKWSNWYRYFSFFLPEDILAVFLWNLTPKWNF